MVRYLYILYLFIHISFVLGTGLIDLPTLKKSPRIATGTLRMLQETGATGLGEGFWHPVLKLSNSEPVSCTWLIHPYGSKNNAVRVRTIWGNSKGGTWIHFWHICIYMDRLDLRVFVLGSTPSLLC